MPKERTWTITRTVTLTKRVCPVCNKKFEGWGKQRFCSKLCANKEAYARNAERYREHRREKYHADKATGRSVKK
jgi:predicted amidophosphoribosyltransferase